MNICIIILGFIAIYVVSMSISLICAKFANDYYDKYYAAMIAFIPVANIGCAMLCIFFFLSMVVEYLINKLIDIMIVRKSFDKIKKFVWHFTGLDKWDINY